MQCKEVKRMISRYIDGEMKEETRKPFEAHLRSCPGCQTQCMKIARMWDSLSDLPGIEPNAWAFTRMSAGLDRPHQVSPASFLSKIFIPASAILVAVFGIWMGSLTWNQQVETIQSNPEDIWTSDYKVSIEPVPESSLSSVYIELASLSNGGFENE